MERIFNKMELVKNQLVMVRQIGDAIAEGLSLKKVMDIATKSIVTLFNFSNAGIFLVMPGKTKLKCKSIYIDSMVLNKLEKITSLKIVGMEVPLTSESYFTHVVETGKHVVINDRIRAFMDYSDDKSFYEKIHAISRISSDKHVVRAPIIIKNEVIGVLTASTKEDVSNTQIDILKLVASQLAMVIFKYNADREMQRQSKHYRRVYDTLNEGIVIFKLLYKGGKAVDYVVLDANPAFYRIMNKVPKDIIGKHGSMLCKNSMKYLDIMDRIVKQNVVQSIDDIINIGDKQYTVNLFNPEDGVVAMTMVDITVRTAIEKNRYKRREEIFQRNLYKIRESQLQMYMKALDYAGIPIVMWRLSGIFYTNRKFLSLTGCDEGSVIGKSMLDFIKEDEVYRYKTHLEIVASSEPGESKMIEISIQCPRGGDIKVNISDTRTELGNGDPIFLSTFIDQMYTKRKIRESNLLLEQIGDEIKRLKDNLVN